MRVRRGAWTPGGRPVAGRVCQYKTPGHAPPEAAWQVSTETSATAGQRLGYREAGSRLFAGRDRDFGDSVTDGGPARRRPKRARSLPISPRGALGCQMHGTRAIAGDGMRPRYSEHELSQLAGNSRQMSHGTRFGRIVVTSPRLACI